MRDQQSRGHELPWPQLDTIAPSPSFLSLLLSPLSHSLSPLSLSLSLSLATSSLRQVTTFFLPAFDKYRFDIMSARKM